MALRHEIIMLMLITVVTANFQKTETNHKSLVLFGRQRSNQNEPEIANVTTGTYAVDSRRGSRSAGHPPPKPWSITKPGYDIRQPPRDPDTGEPVTVQMKVFVDFIKNVNELDGEMAVAFFFRVDWRDNRVRELSDILPDAPGYRQDMLPLSGEIKESVWVPDLYLPMARRVAIPTIHEPAESVVIYKNGAMAYTAFFVIALKCQMSYANYPMDVQVCFMDVMSYKYSADEMNLQWESDQLLGHTNIVTKHFDASLTFPKNRSFIIRNPDGSTRHALRLKIFLKRHLTFYLLQTYLPSAMLVLVGWLSLLVPLDFAYGRMVLAVTTLLVLVSIFVANSQQAPGVNEVKALDIWLFLCIFFVFSAIVDCIVDLRFLSMVEKESLIAGEEGAGGDERPQQSSGGALGQATETVGDSTMSFIKFQGSNTPFQADKEVLIATPAVLKWLRMAVALERSMTVIYPTLFVLLVAIYWSVYLTDYYARTPHSDE